MKKPMKYSQEIERRIAVSIRKTDLLIYENIINTNGYYCNSE